MQIVVGLLKRDAGELERPERVGYCPQVPMLWDKLTVDEHFELCARAYGMDDAARERSVGELLDELQFELVGSVSTPGRAIEDGRCV